MADLTYVIYNREKRGYLASDKSEAIVTRDLRLAQRFSRPVAMEQLGPPHAMYVSPECGGLPDYFIGAKKHGVFTNYYDPVNNPAHYTNHPSGVECIQIVEHMGFCLGNAIKYIWRADSKGNALEDLKKARWYIDREIERRSKPLEGDGDG